jgi:hypothetical protein
MDANAQQSKSSPNGDLQARPQGDSNPCYRRERAMSWASRRWGPDADRMILVELGGIEPPTSCMPCKRSPS